MRRGYKSEYRVKLMLAEKYGELGVLKVAVGGSADFIAIKDGKIDAVIEVKETVKDKYTPTRREKKQFEEIRKFAAFHSIPAQLWIVYRRGTGKKVDIKVLDLMKAPY